MSNARRKVSVILELLRAADLESTSRKHRVTVATLTEWRDRFLAAGEAGLKSREVVVEDEEKRRLKSAVASVSVDNELLREKIVRLESGRPFAWGRSRLARPRNHMKWYHAKSMKSRNRVLACVQLRCDDVPRMNVEKCVAYIDQAAREGAQIVILPELFQHRYFCQTAVHANFSLAEPVPGPTTDVLSGIAASHQVVIVAGLFERRVQGVFHNSAVVLDADGSVAGLYRKMHVPENRQAHEGFYFTPGDLGFRAFNTRYGKIGVLLGWDLYFPEAARITAMHGADLLVFPTASGWNPNDSQHDKDSQHSAWEALLRSHAIANGTYVAAVNRVGFEESTVGHGSGPGIDFWGRSFVATHSGPIISRASGSVEETVVAECDFDKIEVRRTHWPFLRDRRIDGYEGLLRRSGSATDTTRRPES